jgi:hypothetical protein
MTWVQDRISLSNASTSSAYVTLLGGLYSLSAIATWSSGSLQVGMLAGDGSTNIPVGTALSANGQNTVYIPAGQYRITVTTSTAVYATLVRIPAE